MLDTDNSSGRIDHYRRGALAQRITRALTHPLSNDSVVIALDGPWGSGKSWLLDQVEKNLQDKNQSASALVVRFNPWQIGEESDLILEFLVQVALETRPIRTAAIGAVDKSRKVGQTLIKYARALSYGRYLKYAPVPILKEIGEFIDDKSGDITEKLDVADKALESKEKEVPSLGQARDAAKEAIADIDKRLIIMIDDIDRLRSREIRAVMQLVKSVLDFPNTSFVLAFDSAQVAKALAEDGTHDTGIRYLEKIIQLSINVPPLDQQLIIEDVTARFNQALVQTGHTLRPYEEPLVGEALKLVAGLCDMPRDVVRWANHFIWALDALWGSINTADLAIMEGIRIKSRKSSFDILTSCNADFDPSIKDAHFWTRINKAYNSAHSAIKSLFPSKSLDDAIAFTFPSLAGYQHTNSLDKQNRRIGHHEIFDIYKKFSTGNQNLSGNLIDEILNDPALLRERLELISYPTPSPTQIDDFLLFVEYASQDVLPDEYEKIIPIVDFIGKFSTNQVSLEYQDSLNISIIAKNLILSRSNEANNPQLGRLLYDLPIRHVISTAMDLCRLNFLPDNQSYARIQIAMPFIIDSIVNRLDETSVDGFHSKPIGNQNILRTINLLIEILNTTQLQRTSPGGNNDTQPAFILMMNEIPDATIGKWHAKLIHISENSTTPQ